MALLPYMTLFRSENLLSLSQNSKRRMIQRIQTIWLMFGLLGVLFVLTLPAITFTTNAGGVSTEVTHVIKGTGHYEATGDQVQKTETFTIGIALVGFLAAAYLDRKRTRLKSS